MNQGRILFNGKASSTGRVFHKVSIVNGDYVMEGGSAHTITDGAEFAIYREAEFPIKSSPIGVLVAKEVKGFHTTLALPSGSPVTISFIGTAYAVQTRAGDKENLRLHVADNLLDGFRAVAQQMQLSTSDNRKIELVDLDKHPDFRIDLEEERVLFDNLNPLVTKYGLKRMPYTTDNNFDDIYAVIRAAAHFKWHLDLTNLKHTLQNEVELYFYELCQKEDEYDDDFNPIYEVGNNFNDAGEVYISEDSTKMYGFKIVNNTSIELYPSLFYFDNSNFEICRNNHCFSSTRYSQTFSIIISAAHCRSV